MSDPLAAAKIKRTFFSSYNRIETDSQSRISVALLDDELEQLIQVKGRVERDADLDQAGQLFRHVTEIRFGIGHINLTDSLV